MPDPLPSFAVYLAEWQVGETRNTKHVAQALGVTTRKAYALLADACERGQLSRYGYRVAPGVWEDAEGSNLRPNALYWQRDPDPP